LVRVVAMTDTEMKAMFPGSTWAELPEVERFKMANAYMRGLWAGLEGVAAFAVAIDPYVDAAGKYKHKRFTQHFFDWPAQGDLAISWAMSAVVNAADVYVCPMLRVGRERRKANGRGGRWGWVDLDGPLDDGRRAVLAGLGSSVRLVSSGTGHHAYFDLGAVLEPDEVERFNREMVAVLGGDAKWSNESLLRLPGTFSHKPVVFDRLPPALVQRVTL
jgi:hypothetical protein